MGYLGIGNIEMDIIPAIQICNDKKGESLLHLDHGHTRSAFRVNKTRS